MVIEQEPDTIIARAQLFVTHSYPNIATNSLEYSPWNYGIEERVARLCHESNHATESPVAIAFKSQLTCLNLKQMPETVAFNRKKTGS